MTHPETSERYLSLLGLVASGDLGPLTCYRSKTGRIVSFAKTWPKQPPSLAQLTGRARMSFGADQWRRFSPAQKLAWKQTAAAVGMCGTGYSLWIKWWFATQYEWMWKLMSYSPIPCLDYITRSPPTLPARPNIEPHELEDEWTHGRTRYGRKRVFMPANTTEWIPYLPVHHDLPDGDPVIVVPTLIGPGMVYATPPQNNHWHALAFFNTAAIGWTVLKILCIFSDGTYETAHVDIFTIAW